MLCESPPYQSTGLCSAHPASSLLLQSLVPDFLYVPSGTRVYSLYKSHKPKDAISEIPWGPFLLDSSYIDGPALELTLGVHGLDPKSHKGEPGNVIL